MRDYDFAPHTCVIGCMCVKVGDPFYVETTNGLRRDTAVEVAHVWADGPERYRGRQTITHVSEDGQRWISMYWPDDAPENRRTFAATELALLGGGY